MQRMDMCPHEFILSINGSTLKQLEGFKHRTFQQADLFYFIEFLHQHYRKHTSLEDAFTVGLQKTDKTVENALIGFQQYFFEMDHEKRTEKHVNSPKKGSSCKRLNMLLRWMVRQDKKGVDFGIWKKIQPHQLICPIDVHVARVAKKLNLLERKQPDWQAALELTKLLSSLDVNDPVKYDFALFGIGVMEKY